MMLTVTCVMVSKAVLLLYAASASVSDKPASTVTAPSALPVLGRMLSVRPEENSRAGASLTRLTVIEVVAVFDDSCTPSEPAQVKLAGELLRSRPAAPAQSFSGEKRNFERSAVVTT